MILPPDLQIQNHDLHTCINEKFNSKAGLFSSIFWFGRIFCCKKALFVFLCSRKNDPKTARKLKFCSFLRNEQNFKVCLKPTQKWQTHNTNIPPFWVDVGVKKWSPFSILVPQSLIFWYPKSGTLAIFADFGIPKRALPVLETKIWDHFYRPNYPPNPRKNHIGNFHHSKVLFGHFIYLL